MRINHIVVTDTGIGKVLGEIEGFTGYVGTDEHIGSFLGALHAELSVMFDEQMDAIAAAAPNNFWHVYEFNAMGLPKGRLWTHQLEGRGRSRVAGVRFRASKVPVPVDPVLLEPGPTGKTVQQGKHVFVWKAPIVEYKLPVNVGPVDAKAIAYVKNGEIAFYRDNKELIPGRTIGGSFTAAMAAFYAGRAQSSIDVVSRRLQAGRPTNAMFKPTAPKRFSINTDFQAGREKAQREMRKRTGNYIAQARARAGIAQGLWDD